MKKRMFLCLLGIATAASMFSSCKKDTPAPTAEIFATIEGYKVTFTPTVSNVSTYSWDFGDGTAISTELEPVHTYESFGDYTVALKVTGEGGEATTSKVVQIAATSLKDLLTGGIKATIGKTWVFDKAYTVGDGGGPVMATPYRIDIPSAANVLDMFGLGEEYDNEFTFNYDGKYSISPKNGKVLAGAVFGYSSATIVGEPAWAVGLCAANYSAPSNATWTANTTDLVIEAIGDANDPNVPPAHSTVTIKGKNWISFSAGAYFGIYDFPSTATLIIDEITPSKMRVTMLVCGYGFDGGDPKYNMMPSNMFHLTYISK